MLTLVRVSPPEAGGPFDASESGSGERVSEKPRVPYFETPANTQVFLNGELTQEQRDRLLPTLGTFYRYLTNQPEPETPTDSGSHLFGWGPEGQLVISGNSLLPPEEVVILVEGAAEFEGQAVELYKDSSLVQEPQVLDHQPAWRTDEYGLRID